MGFSVGNDSINDADESGSAIGADGRYTTDLKKGNNTYTFAMTLTISRVQQSDTGEYICQYGEKTDSIYLHGILRNYLDS